MIICDNIVFELQAVGGVSKYWSKTISRLDRSLSDLSFLEGSKVKGNVFRNMMQLESPILKESGNLFLRRLINPKLTADVFHSSYYRISHRARANVVTIHDFMNEKFPSSFRDPILAQLKKRAAKHADAIVVVSDRTRLDLLLHYPFVDPGRVHVTYNGVDEEYFPEPVADYFQAGSETLHPKGFFLYVGTRGLCKNFPFVLKFVAEAWAQGQKLPLVVIGGGPLSASEYSTAAALGMSRDALVQLSGLPDTVLRKLYSNCIALLIPSIYEGFGLPAAEAARCRALVLSARGSALDEIVGETDYAFDLGRCGEAKRLLTLGLDSAAANMERQRLYERSEMFNWASSTDKLLEIYDGL